MMFTKFLDFRAHPPRILKSTTIGNDDEDFGTKQAGAQRAVESLAGRRLLLAEEDAEVRSRKRRARSEA